MQLALILLAVGLVAAEQPPQEAQPAVVAVPAQAEPAPVVVGVHQHNGQTFPGEHHTHEHHHVSHEPHHHESVAHYAPSGVIQVIGQQQQQQQPAGPADKPQVVSRPAQYAPTGEQYGRPESQALPPNYKPFGSWGLYIGGNPADGYYSNYYEQLGNSLADKQEADEKVRPVVSPSSQSSSSAGISRASAFAPILKQASSFGPSYADQVYPSYTDYYTPADLNSGSAMPSVYASSQRAIVSPVQVGAQVYGAPISYSSEPLTYSPVDSYAATKRVGSVKSEQQPQQFKGQQQQQQQQQQYHYRYAAAPAVAQQQQVYHYQPQQVVAYPVPVGSQIVGSQPGVEGAHQPYGVHGYTRYAIKPTVVAGEQSYYQQHSSPVAHYPIYKQQQQQSYQPVASYQPLSFYGYPLSQLHYSQGSIVPAFGQQSQAVPSGAVQSPAVVAEHQQQQHHHHHVAPVVGQVEAASSDKSETSEAAVNKQQQKKA